MIDANPRSSSRQDEWKHKCVSLARVLDTRTKQWRQQESQLRDSVLKLSNVLVQQIPSASLHLSSISSAIEHSDFSQVDQLLSELRAELQAAIPASKSVPEAADNRELVHKVAQILQAAPIPESQKRQWLNTLQNSSKMDGLLVDLIEKASESDASLMQLADPVRQHLLEIVDNLKGVNSVDVSSEQALRAQINRPWDWNALPQLLGQMAAYATETQKNSRLTHKRLEHVIQEISQELGLMEHVTRDSKQDVSAARSHRQQLQSSMADEVLCMQQDLANSQDVGTLKDPLNDRLQNIRSHISHYAEQEERRLEATEARNDALEKRLKRLEQESLSLKEELRSTYEQLMLDRLTGVANRFAYEEYLDQVDWSAPTQPADLCYALWDIDFFKSINDTYGHKAGDRVLQLVAQHIQNQIKESQFFARIGGEEFVTLMPNYTPEQALEDCNKIRESIANSGFNYKGEAVNISISAGISLRLDGDDRDSLYIRADHALYQAKSKGRDQCIFNRDTMNE